MHKNIDYESLLTFVQDNPNAGISLTISENEFDQVIETIISALITNETPPTQLVSYLEYRLYKANNVKYYGLLAWIPGLWLFTQVVNIVQKYEVFS